MIFPKQLFFNDLTETELIELAPESPIPEWLNGAFIRNGPSLFNYSSTQLNHWFDGMAMLHKITFNQGKVSYMSKFPHSKAYAALREKGKINYDEFATSQKQSLLKHIFNLLRGQVTDNNNVNVIQYGSSLLAMTETDNHALIDPNTLSIIGRHNYPDKVKFAINLAHPIVDEKQGKLYNLGIEFGHISSYNLYQTDISSNTRQIIAKIPSQSISYTHSFAKTESFFILYENPLKLNLKKMFFSNRPFIENHEWTSAGVDFSVIDKQGKVVAKITADNFFCFHIVNSFEETNQIHLDLITYPNADIIQSFYFKQAANYDHALPQLNRYTLDLATNTYHKQKYSLNPLEFTCINNLYAQKSYNYFYGVSALKNTDTELSSLIKVNLSDLTTVKYWHEEDCYSGEPAFIAKPNAQNEDDGILISIVSNLANKSSFILILDATSFNEISRIQLPHMLPFGLHGEFYPIN